MTSLQASELYSHDDFFFIIFFCSDKYIRFCQWKNLELNIQLTMNDFSVHRIIGRGGFGEVYGCRKADTGKMWVRTRMRRFGLRLAAVGCKVSVNIVAAKDVVARASKHRFARRDSTNVFISLPACAPCRTFRPPAFNVHNMLQYLILEIQLQSSTYHLHLTSYRLPPPLSAWRQQAAVGYQQFFLGYSTNTSFPLCCFRASNAVKRAPLWCVACICDTVEHASTTCVGLGLC